MAGGENHAARRNEGAEHGATGRLVQLTPRASAAGRPLILVVDDVEDNRAMYADYLEYAGY